MSTAMQTRVARFFYLKQSNIVLKGAKLKDAYFIVNTFSFQNFHDITETFIWILQLVNDRGTKFSRGRGSQTYFLV